jgi:23S rRNA-/tRNA-specific pseudouridylate synthase
MNNLHGFAHALIDQELREKKVTKIYYALVGGAIEQLSEHQLTCMELNAHSCCLGSSFCEPIFCTSKLTCFDTF